MSLKLFNTMTRQIEVLKPLKDSEVSLYTCGLTVYSQPHIGNWVYFIFCDILHRTLLQNGYNVKRVQNITDVGHLTSDEDSGEDKMQKSAFKEGITAWDIAKKYIEIADHEAFDMLRFLRPEYLPRATDYIPQQIEFVKELEKKGYTYTIADGVYFDTIKLTDYGKLAKLDINGLQFGARVADTGKKSPTDFALWKFSPANEKRDMEWDSPWGKGFPGWHLECSVMARELLGDTIDIHTGGIDHIPVHHTNEIAQSEALTGKTFANMWVHANHIKVDGTKMSKSLGNIYTLQDIKDKGFDLEAFKLMILSKHYRTEGNFTWEILEAAQNRLTGYRVMADMLWQPLAADSTLNFDKYKADTLQAINNDLDTPSVLAIISALTDDINTNFINVNEVAIFKELLAFIDSLLGLTLSNRPDITDAQKTLIKQREQARLDKDFTGSDKLRAELEKQNLLVRDTSRGSIWSRI